MDKIVDVIINEAVIHVLDNNADEPVLNEFKLELNESIYKFILSHIYKIFKDDNLKYAFFNSKEGNIIRDLSQEYLNGYDDLLSVSKEFSNQLFTLMKSNIAIPSCDLLVVSISTEYGPMIGIIKLDFIKHYTHKIDFVENKIGVNIAHIPTGLPVNKKVSKAAFIKPVRVEQEYDLLVLDKVSAKNNDEYGANYFVDNFLGCNLIDNDRDRTRAFIGAMETWTRSNLNGDAAKAEKIRTFVREQLKLNDQINVYDLAPVILPKEKEAQKDLIGFMQSQELEDVQVDKEYLEKKLRKVKIKISSDIDISITEEAYKDINKFQVVDNGDGSIHMIIKNIERYLEK